MKVTRDKNCYCHTCKKDYHYLGITRHRAMHRNKKQNCEITYTNGDTYEHNYEKRGQDKSLQQKNTEQEMNHGIFGKTNRG